MNVFVRVAQDEDADQLAAILNEIVSIGGLTSREGLFDGGAYVRNSFLLHAASPVSWRWQAPM